MLSFRNGIPLALFLLFPASILLAQAGEDNGTLYFPPKLIASYQFGEGQPSLGITESITPTSMALPPVVFFDHPGDWSIPPRYQIFTGSFRARDYTDTNTTRNWDPMGKYWEILNIIGYRMGVYPQTSIVLQGGYSTEPGENEEVGRARAEVIREYLMNVWRVAPERISLLPARQLSDSSDNGFLRQEARRVDITSANWEILQPVSYTISFRTVGSLYMRLTVDPYTQPEDVQEIEFVMTAGDKIMGRVVIPGHNDSTIYQVMAAWWKNESQDGLDERFLEDIDLSAISLDAYVRLYDGKIRRSNTERIDVRTHQYETGRGAIPNSLTLPFYAFGDSNMLGYHRFLIDSFLVQQNLEGPIAMELMGRADLSEDPETDDATYAEYMGTTVEEEYIPIDEPALQFGQLTIWSPAEEDRYQYYYDEDLYQEEAAMMSREAEVTQWKQDSIEMASLENKYTSDSLAMARTRVVERYFRDTLKLDLSTFDQLPGRMRSVASTFAFLPEERWFARSVVLVIYPYDRFVQQRDWMKEQADRRERQPIDR